MTYNTTIIPLSALQTNKSNQLSISNNNPKFYITVNDYVIYDNIIFYICEVGISNNKNDVLIKHVKLRYSRLYDLYQYLLKHYSKVHKFRPFPPKKILWNGTKECAEERLPILNSFLSELTTIYNLINDYTFREYLMLNDKY